MPGKSLDLGIWQTGAAKIEEGGPGKVNLEKILLVERDAIELKLRANLFRDTGEGGDGFNAAYRAANSRSQQETEASASTAEFKDVVVAVKIALPDQSFEGSNWGFSVAVDVIGTLGFEKTTADAVGIEKTVMASECLISYPKSRTAIMMPHHVEPIASILELHSQGDCQEDERLGESVAETHGIKDGEINHLLLQTVTDCEGKGGACDLFGAGVEEDGMKFL